MPAATPSVINPARYLSKESARRKPSPLTHLARHAAREGLISLGGGYPHPSLFPLSELSFEVETPAGTNAAYKLAKLPSQRAGSNAAASPAAATLPLASWQQYGSAGGDASLEHWLRDLTVALHQPKYADWGVTCCVGAGDGIYKSLRLLCEPGDKVIVEAYTYPATLETISAIGLAKVPIAMDAEGMRADALRDALENWTDGKKPVCMYTVPSGQNPMGCTQSAERRKEIMAICVAHDIIVIEDGPYDMLTMGTFDPSAPVVEQKPIKPSAERREAFLKDLTPSYLSLDTTGRVLRIDSFSKVFFPGARVGWVTGHKTFCERIMRHSETSTRMPAGLSQAVLSATLVGSKDAPGWGLTGWFDWLADLRDLYTARRNVLLGALHALAAHPHGKGRLNWVDPTCGMFIVLYVDLESTPRFKAGSATVAELLQELFNRCIDGPKGDGKNGVLLASGDLFSVADEDKDKANFVRMTYAYASNEDMVTAVERFGVALEALWTS